MEEKKYRQLIVTTEWGQWEMGVCLKCGSLVCDEVKHTMWHELNSQPASANQKE